MLRRILLAVLVSLFAVGFVSGDEAFGGMDCEHFSLQLEADAAGCGSEGTAPAVCAVACHGGTCLSPALLDVSPAVFSLRPSDRLAIAASDHRCAPETAPPKPFAV